MIPRGEQIRNLITDTLARSSIDAGDLAVEVLEDSVVLKGTVSSADEERAVRAALAGLPGLKRLRYGIRVVPVAPSPARSRTAR